MPSWDPEVYERYKVYRDRPALDLLVQIPAGLDPREIWDLGCGTGEHAALLAGRHPQARVHGLDSSPDMLAVARRRDARVDWVEGDAARFAPETPPDLIFTNAALQWVPDHSNLFPRLVAALTPGGVFACQMPMTFETSWHGALRAVADEPRWRLKLGEVRGTPPVAAPPDYHGWLAPLCDSVDLWTTTYLHVLEGRDPVVEWMQGTGLRPYLDALSGPDERDNFLAEYRARLSRLFERRPDGTTLFPFPRLFMVARRLG
jgi:trans-aconitate 2-methyltransferase